MQRRAFEQVERDEVDDDGYTVDVEGLKDAAVVSRFDSFARPAHEA